MLITLGDWSHRQTPLQAIKLHCRVRFVYDLQSTKLAIIPINFDISHILEDTKFIADWKIKEICLSKYSNSLKSGHQKNLRDKDISKVNDAIYF